MTTEHTPLRALFQLAWPIVLARATQAVIGFCDALMVAPLGEVSLAAVTTGSMNIFTLTILPMGIVFILQSFAAQLRGRGDLLAAVRFGYYGVVLAAGAGLIGLMALPAIAPLLSLIGYEPAVEAAMGSYLQIRLLSVAAAVGVEALGNWYGGLGNTRPAMVAGIVAMAVNVALNAVLIEPHFGLPGYGVSGAAWASVIASWAGFATVLWGFLRGAGYERAAGRIDLRIGELRRVLRFGVPNGLNWFLEFAAFALFINVCIGHIGTTALAAFNVVLQLNSVSFMPAFGVSSAGAIQVGEAIGRGRHDEVAAILRRTLGVCVVWMGGVGLCYLALPGPIFSLFATDDAQGQALLSVGSVMLSLSALWQVFDATTMSVSEALRAAGDTAWAMWTRLFFGWVLFTPVSWAAVFVYGADVPTVMTVLIAYTALQAGAFAWRFWSGRWRDIDLVGAGEPTLV